MTTRIHRLAEALGWPLRFAITAGQAGDVIAAPALIEGMVGSAVLADKAYDPIRPKDDTLRRLRLPRGGDDMAALNVDQSQG